MNLLALIEGGLVCVSKISGLKSKCPLTLQEKEWLKSNIEKPVIREYLWFGSSIAELTSIFKTLFFRAKVPGTSVFSLWSAATPSSGPLGLGPVPSSAFSAAEAVSEGASPVSGAEGSSWLEGSFVVAGALSLPASMFLMKSSVDCTGKTAFVSSTYSIETRFLKSTRKRPVTRCSSLYSSSNSLT